MKIRVTPDGPWRMMTTAHEIGHMLDRGAIPRRDGDGETRDRVYRRDAQFKSWLRAVVETEAFQTLKRRRNDQAADERERNRVKYLRRVSELWARSYAQYVAIRSESPDMAEELDKARRAEAGLQWGDDDFEPIARAIDGLLQSLGWRK